MIFRKKDGGEPHFDRMTKTPVSKLIIALSVPSIISMLVTNIYNLVDTAFVGQLGTSASGAVGIVFGFMAVIQAFGFMFGQGAGSILSRALGARDTDSASVHASAGFFSSFAFGIIISAVEVIWLDGIVRLLGSTETIAPYAKTYIFYILLAAPFMTSSLTLNNLLRYEGKASLGMVGLMTGAVLNMIGDPVLMFGLKLGIAGAGLSTALSQLVSWGILLWMFHSGKTESKISLKRAAEFSPRMIANIMATGFPSLLRQGLNSLATVLLNAQCAVYGDAAVAAMSIVSQKYSRIRKGFAFTSLASEGIILLGCSFLMIFSGDLIALFRDDPDVIEIGTRALILQALATLALPPCMATEMLYQSTGKRLGASLLSAIRSGLLFIPSLLILSNLRGLAGIQEAQPVSLLLSVPFTALFAILFFKNLQRDVASGAPMEKSP